jgi:predicted negative regulator of RcsB-dependent stress response
LTLDPGEAISGITHALKGNPLCLAIVVLIIVLQLIAYYRESQAQDDRLQVTSALIERCMEPAKR